MSFVDRDSVFDTLPQFSSEHPWNSPEYKAEWYKFNRKRLRDAGLCYDCHEPSVDQVRCQACREKYKLRKSNLQEERKAQGLCTSCGEVTNPTYTLCSICRIKQRENYWKDSEKVKASLSKRNYNAKQFVMEHYGSTCICGESRLPCLELDHINNDGGDHRESLGLKRHSGGMPFYRKLIKLNYFPTDLQILCANCHAMKHAVRWEQ